MQQYLEELNLEQRDAVEHGEGPLLIIAGAGTGKTRVITYRIVHLINTKKARPEEILALTFTEKAATEMEERVDILVPYGYNDVWIGTFHAFGDSVLREHALEVGISTDFRVLSQPEQVIFLRRHLFDLPLNYFRPLGDPTKHLQALLKVISRAKDEDVSPEEYLRYADTLYRAVIAQPENPKLRTSRPTLRQAQGVQFCEHGEPVEPSTKSPNSELLDEALRQREVAEFYRYYQEIMAKESFIDFGDQVNLVLKLFRERAAILKEYQERFKYILVDEFQDTNYAQFELVRLLADRHRNMTVVGDDDQSIYKFRGAAISNILKFKEHYPEAKQIVLTRNYRSTQNILDAAYRLIQFNNPDRLEVRNQIDKRLIAVQHRNTASPQHLYYDTLTSESDGVASIIEKKVKDEGCRYRDFAILVRSNNDADPFLRSLNMKGIPFRFSGSRGLYSRADVRLMISFLKVISDFSDSISLYHLASSQIYRVPPYDLTLCMNKASRMNYTLHHIFLHLNDYPDLSDTLSTEGKATIQKIIEDVIKYNKMSVEVSPGQLLYSFITETGYLKRLSQMLTPMTEESVQNIAKFFETIKNFELFSPAEKVTHFVKYLDLLIEAGDDPATAEVDPDLDAVNVITVHKAKGLEFPVVFIVSLVEGKFPLRRKSDPIELPDALVKDTLPSGDFHYQEERRLFYVGMTRALKELHFTAARDYGGMRSRKISRFVKEALDMPDVEKELFKASAIEAIERFASTGSASTSSALNLFESRDLRQSQAEPVEAMTLSHYQIDDYLTCPLKYKYIHILRVPIMQHHSVIYGKAMHDAVSEYYRKKIKGREIDIEDLLAVFERSWQSEGFLTREHEEQRFEAGMSALRMFYNREEAKGSIPTYIEKEFLFKIDNTVVKGRWDRVDEDANGVVIIDYKTSDVVREKEAQRRAKESLQLSIYALAYREKFGKIPDRLELHFIESGLIGVTQKTEKEMGETIEIIRNVSSAIRSKVFTAKPGYMACGYCAYQGICNEKINY